MAGTGNTSIRTYNFFRDDVILVAGAYVDNGPFTFVDQVDGTPFLSHTIQLINDGANDIFFSFDGVTDNGRVPAGGDLTQSFRRERKIWFRGTAADAYRFWAW